MSISDHQRTYHDDHTGGVDEERSSPWGTLRDERPAGFEDQPPVDGSVDEADRDSEVESPDAYRSDVSDDEYVSGPESVEDDETAVGRARVPEQRAAAEPISENGSPTLYDAEAGTALSGAAVPEQDLDRYDERLSRVDRDLDTAAPHPADVEDESTAVLDTDEERAGTLPADAGLKPGEATVDPIDNLWDDGKLSEFRDRWREAQLSFVDDPRQAVEQVRSVVDEAVDLVTGALAGQRDALNDWQDGQDTEQLRMVLRRYRTFFDRVLDL